MNCPKCDAPLEIVSKLGKWFRVCLNCQGYEAEITEGFE